MKESAVVVGLDGSPLYWHLPQGRTAVSIPDTRDLWDVLWEHRANLSGVAHSHPGSGRPTPSQTDLTTFSAIEAGLGQRFNWWICNSDQVIVIRWSEDAKLYQARTWDSVSEPSRWLEQLRHNSFDPR